MITPDDPGWISDLSDSLDVLCGNLGLLSTLTWSRYLSHGNSGRLLHWVSSCERHQRLPRVRQRSGITNVCQRIRLENVEATGEVGDGLFHDFSREEDGQFPNGTHAWGCATEETFGFYFASIPNARCRAGRGLPTQHERP